MNDYIDCYGFRCNLTIKDITLYNVNLPDTVEGRNEKFKEFFNYLMEEKKLKSTYKKRKYILIYKDELTGVLHCQIARKREVSINELSDVNIIEKKEEDHPYVNVFIDLNGQKIIIEAKYSVFDNVDTCKKVLEHIMGNYFKRYDILIEINPITEKSDFKSCFSKGKICNVKFELNVPNWGSASSAAKELVESSKKVGADKIVYSLNNKDGNISYNEYMESFADYTAAGAGKWKITGRDENGTKYSVQSEEKKKKIVITSTREQLSEKLDEVKLLIIQDAFDKIEHVERLKMNYENKG